MPRTAIVPPLSSSASAARSGLMVPGRTEPIPLERVHVEVTCVDLAARVTLRQHFRNSEAVPLEVVYVFPLDAAAAVCGFTARVDGVRFDGVVKERDEAFKEYDDAMEVGHGAYLLDEERADVLTVSLGNLKPGSEVDLEITYVTELAAEGQAVRFTLPTTVSPRYAPAEDQSGVGPTPAEALNPPVQFDVPYRFTFEMDVTMAGAIRGIESPSHPIAIELDGMRARVRLAQREAVMDGDLVIVIAAQGLDVPHATVERGGKDDTAMVSFVPSFAAAGVRYAVRKSNALHTVFRSAESPSDCAEECYQMEDAFEADDPAFGDATALSAPSAPRSLRPHDRLVGLQRADGSWDLDEAFAESVWMHLATLEEALAGAFGDQDVVRRALATAVAIAWLESHAPDAMVEWEMLAGKGVAWLQSCGAAPAGGGDWLELGRAVVV
jgi:hypothetical protein